jgi:hypothetical protein
VKTRKTGFNKTRQKPKSSRGWFSVVPNVGLNPNSTAELQFYKPTGKLFK